MSEPEKNATDAQGPTPAHREPSPSQFLRGTAFAERMDAMFIGPDGLRSGWRLLLYLTIRKGLLLLFGMVVYWVAQSELPDLWTSLLAESVLLVVALVPALFLARLEERPFGGYGLPRRRAFGKFFWVGAAWGIGALTVLMFAMHGAGVFDLGGLAVHGVRALKFAAFWGLYFLVVGFAEEFYLRGYTQFTLTQAIGFWPAAVVLSIFFAYLHGRNPGETLPGLVGAGLIGLFFCLTLRRTGSLWFAVGFHAAWDWGESYFYSVPDSGTVAPGHLLKTSLHGPAWLTGGSAGPEASLFVFVVIALLWVAFDRVYRQARYGSTDPFVVGSAD